MTQLAENPFAPPQSDVRGPAPRQAASDQVWREGNLAVCPDGAHLAARCVLCNEATHGYELTKIVRWHHPAIYLVLLVNLLIYVIVAIAVQRKAKLTFGLCPRHRSRRSRGMWIGYLGLFASVVLLLFGVSNGGGGGGGLPAGMVAVGLAGIVLLPITGMIMVTVLRPKRVADNKAYLKLGEGFVRTLPNGPPED